MESLPRIDFVELHDLDRTPAVLRTLHTESIAFIYRLTDAAREYSVPLSLALRSGADHRIVDLCAGSGGPVPLIQRRLHREGVHTQVTLTDLVPNVPAFQRVQAAHRRVLPDCCSVDYVSSSVDATDCQVEGTRTIYGAFHHFPPPLARRMLQNAVDTRSPMVVVDTKRSLLYVLLFPFFTTLAVLVFRAVPTESAAALPVAAGGDLSGAGAAVHDVLRQRRVVPAHVRARGTAADGRRTGRHRVVHVADRRCAGLHRSPVPDRCSRMRGSHSRGVRPPPV